MANQERRETNRVPRFPAQRLRITGAVRPGLPDLVKRYPVSPTSLPRSHSRVLVVGVLKPRLTPATRDFATKQRQPFQEP